MENNLLMNILLNTKFQFTAVMNRFISVKININIQIFLSYLVQYYLISCLDHYLQSLIFLTNDRLENFDPNYFLVVSYSLHPGDHDHTIMVLSIKGDHDLLERLSVDVWNCGILSSVSNW